MGIRMQNHAMKWNMLFRFSKRVAL